MSTARTPCLYQSVLSLRLFSKVEHVTPTAATAHDVFEINACHGNTFENSFQTTCQLQYILVGLLYYSTWDVHRKKNNLAVRLWRAVCTWWQQRTLRAHWLLCGMSTLFYISLMADIKPSGAFFTSLAVIPQWHRWHIVQHYNYSSSRTSNGAVCRIRCPQRWDQYDMVHFNSFHRGGWLIRAKLIGY